MKPRILMLCLAATLVLAGCGNKSQTADEPVVSSLPPTSVTADPYAVPSVIDATYINKVLAAIENGRGTMPSLPNNPLPLSTHVIKTVRAS